MRREEECDSGGRSCERIRNLTTGTSRLNRTVRMRPRSLRCVSRGFSSGVVLLRDPAPSQNTESFRHTGPEARNYTESVGAPGFEPTLPLPIHHPVRSFIIVRYRSILVGVRVTMCVTPGPPRGPLSAVVSTILCNSGLKGGLSVVGEAAHSQAAGETASSSSGGQRFSSWRRLMSI